MSRVKLLTDHDIAEVERFREYLGDLNGVMPSADFAEKWHEYMGVTEGYAEKYCRAKRTEAGEPRTQKETEK